MNPATHVSILPYSRLFAENSISESEVVDHLTRLMYRYDQETPNPAKESESELANTVQELLDTNQYVFFLARENRKDRIVGYGILRVYPEPTQGEFAEAYVQRGFRRRGIFGALSEHVTRTAQQMGMQELFAYPASDQRSRRVLERQGYAVFGEFAKDQDVTLRKVLPGSDPETTCDLRYEGTPPGMRR